VGVGAWRGLGHMESPWNIFQAPPSFSRYGMSEFTKSLMTAMHGNKQYRLLLPI
jgi:hypothetical protein